MLLLLPIVVFYQNKQDISITAHQLYDSFEQNDSLASLTYLDYSLRVSGILSRKEINHNQLILLLSTVDAESFIYCEMKSSQENLINELISGMSVTVNGECFRKGNKTH